MTFYINKTNGTALATIADGTINTTSSSITLVGKNFPTYGQILNQNLISMLENFSNSSSPLNPLVGQIWYDNGNNILKFYRGGTSNNYWQTINTIISSTTAPTTAQQNDFWWDSTNQQLKIYNNLNWIIIGPQTSNSGIIQIPAGNSFNVEIGSTTVLNVDSSGRVNIPYNPIVQGIGRSSGQFTGTGLLSPTTWIPASAPINIGTNSLTGTTFPNFNTSTGVFTCPIEGIYFVSGTVISLGYTVATTQGLAWYKNNSDTGIDSRCKHTNNNVITPLTASGYIQCQAGDVIQMVVYADANGVIDSNNSSMSIRLVA